MLGILIAFKIIAIAAKTAIKVIDFVFKTNLFKIS
jgi:hypothetical protein